MAREKFKNISHPRPGAIKGEGGGGSRDFCRRHGEVGPLTSACGPGPGVETTRILKLLVPRLTGFREGQGRVQTSQLGARVHFYHTANGENTMNNFELLTHYLVTTRPRVWLLLRLVTRNQSRSPHLSRDLAMVCPPCDQSQAGMERRRPIRGRCPGITDSPVLNKAQHTWATLTQTSTI